MSDNDLFVREMAGVEPLGRDARVRLVKDRLSDDQQRGRRRAAAGEDHAINPLADEGISPLDAWFVLEFKRPGIQNGVYRKLRLGYYQVDARLDLHRMVVKQAREEVFSFIEEATRLGLRTLLIVHGKGQSKSQGDQTAVLKGYVNHWLQHLDQVQAFHSAQPQHGGTGAVYVLLKKSAKQKRENRLQYQKGRVQD
ncbi:DNA endonuclease SmrA [Luminiphilus sp.]|nr:DNA endonuclease SmrA [Luminiphilus sp.]MDA9710813.1 DNA endonuclease SmrA [Luminiphilus sp.]